MVNTNDNDRINIDDNNHLLSGESDQELEQKAKFPILIADDTIQSEDDVAAYAATLVNGERQCLIYDRKMYLTDGTGSMEKITGSEDIDTSNLATKEDISNLETRDDELDEKILNLNKRSIIGEKLDYGYFTLSSSQTTNLDTDNIILFKNNSNINYPIECEDGIFKLKANTTYNIQVQLRCVFSNSNGYFEFKLKNLTEDISLTTDNGYSIGSVVPFKYSYDMVTNAPVLSITYTPDVDSEWAVVVHRNSTCINIDSRFSYLSIQEIGRQVIVDPLEHVNEESGIEDSPVGHIISHIGLTAPKHYLICDGSEYNISDYPKLAEHFQNEFGSVNYYGGDGVTTFAVPDMRGEFIRGYDESNLRDPEGDTRGIGKHQEGTTHRNFVVNYTNNYLQAIGRDIKYDNVEDVTKQTAFNEYQSKNSFTSSKWNNIATFKSRPTNVNVLFCIKYEPTYFMNYSPKYIGFDSEVIFEGEADAEGKKYELKKNIQNYEILLVMCGQKWNNPNRQQGAHIPIYVSDINGDNCQFLYNANVSSKLRRIVFGFPDNTHLEIGMLNRGDAKYSAIYKIIGIKSGSNSTLNKDILDNFTLKDNKIAYKDSILFTEEDIKSLKVPADNIIVSVNENGVSSKKTLQEVIDLLLDSSNVKPPSESAIVTVACGEGHCGEAYCGE